MFADAIDIASGFTFPYVGLRLYADGKVRSVVATFIVINADGWVVTSAHVLEELMASGGITRDDGVAAPADPEVVNHAEIWAVPAFERTKPRLVSGRVNPAADIAVGRIAPFDGTGIGAYPVLRDTVAQPVRQGESVCRLGFPFHDFAATHDAQTMQFNVAPGSFPAPRFALDGTVSRFSERRGPDGVGQFIETSTPGLRGQSGGPLLDVAGRIIGVQSHTAHLDLGFDARYLDAEGATVIERQFLNVGLATHVEELVKMMELDSVEYRRA